MIFRAGMIRLPAADVVAALGLPDGCVLTGLRMDGPTVTALVRDHEGLPEIKMTADGKAMIPLVDIRDGAFHHVGSDDPAPAAAAAE